MPNMKTVGQRILKLLGGEWSLVNTPVALTFGLKINRANLLIMTNQYTKYEEFGSKES
jgi:hypothetical protein